MSRRPVLAALVMPLLAAPVAAAVPPLTAYGALPDVSEVALAPDGSAVAAMVGQGEARGMQLRSLPDLKPLTLFKTGDAKIRGLQFVGPEHLVLTYSTTAKAKGVEGDRREWYMALSYNVKTGKWDKLLDDVPGAMNVVLGDPIALPDEKKDVIAIEGMSSASDYILITLFRVNLNTRNTKQLDVGNINTVGWVVGPDGRGVARADYKQASGEWTLFVRPPGNSGWKSSKTFVAPVDPPELLGYGRDTGTVLVSTLAEDGVQIFAVSLADGSWSAPLVDFESDGLLRDRATKTVFGSVSTDMASRQYKFLSDADQKLWAALQRAFPGETLSFVDWSDDRMVAVVEVEGAKNGDAYFLVDRRAKKADWLANRYQGIEADGVSEQRVVRYKAADGLEIPAYLTLPRGRAAKGLPLVVVPHGGPQARDYPGFDWWAQALASRGYAVLQPQFRGSSGLGTAHVAAGYGEWGRKMQTDLSDGVRHLAKEGIIDPRRVCIAGSSYGGYAALAGAAFDAGVYRCAVSVAGVSDLRRLLGEEAPGRQGSGAASARYWQRFMGVKSASDTSIDAWSPALHADGIKAPVLLIHGKDDLVVPYGHSQQMEKAMKSAGGKVEFVTLQGEDHYLSRSATRTQMLLAMVAFLERHNPP